MRARWRKIIWVILTLQLFLLHMQFLMRNDELDYFVVRVVRHFGLPSFLYAHWKQLILSGWLATVGVVLLLHYHNYRKFRDFCIRNLKTVSDESVKQSLEAAVRETRLRERTFLYRCQGIREPFVIGFLHPILLLPEQEYSKRVLEFIFLHECNHIRHRDTLYKLFLLLMQSLLWFQPLMYLLKAVGDRDVEVACDEAVVAGRNMEERREYGYALLECVRQARQKGMAYSAYFYHGKRLMEARISAIMKEGRKWDMLAYVGIVVLLLDLGFNAYRVGSDMYVMYQAGKPEPMVPIYEGYEIPDSFCDDAVERMMHLTPVSEMARHEEYLSGDFYEE